jgi:cysteine desulfurase/selenocysteine lyase
VAPVDDSGDVPVAAFRQKLNARTKVVALAHVSNTLGTILPVREVADLAHGVGAVVVVDGAQAAPHLRVDTSELGCDFYAFSGHKLYGPNGVGALWGRRELFETFEPYQTGGGMIRVVTFDETTFAGLPERFEAGTPNVAGAIGLGAAVDYLAGFDRASLERHEHDLLDYGTRALRDVAGLRLIGTAPRKIGVLSFVVDGIHPHDLGTILDREGVAIRAGHHCTQPLMKRFGVAATARASFGAYNGRDDVDQLVAAIRKSQEMFS